MSPTWVWGGVAIFVVISMVAAIWSRAGRSQNMSDYFLGGRRMGGFVSALSYSATTYSAFMMIGLAGLTYTGGVGALGFELLYLCGVTLVLVFGPRFWRVGKTFGYVTPSEMLAHRYRSQAAGTTTALASFVFLLPYAAVQLAGVGYLLSGMTSGTISFTAGTLVALALAVAFAMIAGLRSVAWTDSVQAVLMILGATLVVIIVISQLGGLGSFFSTLSSDHPGALSVPGDGFFTFSTFLALTLPWIFFSISNPQVSQRLFTPGSIRDLRRMLIGFLIFGLIYTFVAVFWGFAARIHFPGLDTPDSATPTLLASDLVPAPLAIIVMVGIMAACISTIDSIMLTLSSMISRDVVAARSRVSERTQLMVGKLVIPVVGVMAYLFAHLQLDLIAVLSVSASAGLLVIVPPTIGAFFWKRGTSAGVISSVVLAGALVLVLEYTGTRPLGQGSGIWGLTAAVVLFVGVSLATSAPRDRAEEFITASRRKLKPGKAGAAAAAAGQPRSASASRHG